MEIGRIGGEVTSSGGRYGSAAGMCRLSVLHEPRAMMYECRSLVDRSIAVVRESTWGFGAILPCLSRLRGDPQLRPGCRDFSVTTAMLFGNVQARAIHLRSAEILRGARA